MSEWWFNFTARTGYQVQSRKLYFQLLIDDTLLRGDTLLIGDIFLHLAAIDFSSFVQLRSI